MKPTLPVALVVLLSAAPLAAGSADDDLQAVRRAVGSSRTAEARPPAEDPAPPAAARERAREGGPRWFRVRVVEKAGKRAKVSVNLPLGLARCLGDDWPIGGRDGRPGAKTTLGEVLRALDSGQSLVEIEDDEASVRVWID